MSLEELNGIVERLNAKLESLPSYQVCENSLVPEGRVWCAYYDQTFAGRCNESCPGYENKFLSNNK